MAECEIFQARAGLGRHSLPLKCKSTVNLSNLQDSAAVCVSDLRSHLCFLLEISSSCTQVLSLNILQIEMFSPGKTASFFMSAALTSAFPSFHAALEPASLFPLCCPHMLWAHCALCSESVPNLQICSHSNRMKDTKFLPMKSKIMYSQNLRVVSLQ